MNRVIEDLYNGNLCPCERFKPILRHYREKREEAFQGYETFLEKLDPNRPKEFDAIMVKHAEVLSLEMEQNFSDGFRLGVRLMCEVFLQEDAENYLEALTKEMGQPRQKAMGILLDPVIGFRVSPLSAYFDSSTSSICSPDGKNDARRSVRVDASNVM